MFPNDWAPPPCGSCCTKKYAAIVEIPWRIFCKKGCSADGDTWEECLESCNEICYKDPVIKDYQWSSYIDRSPGDNNYSLKCFHACASGCGFKFGISPEEAGRVHPNRPLPPPPPSPIIADKPSSMIDAKPTADDDLPGTSA
ncbi:hypothetical protein HPP92_014805 [Vanilla planifolia]|uniref:Uncharacterized protein n=1 Tax=Vanilla planifolia TaxID=51239 RepID=A0A835QK08_VANPL|nr:hypothetical protein HPP92_014805 [Vanilla planifolia]